jgi:hypothetical protein
MRRVEMDPAPRRCQTGADVLAQAVALALMLAPPPGYHECSTRNLRAPAGPVFVRGTTCRNARALVREWYAEVFNGGGNALDSSVGGYACKGRSRQGETNPYVHVKCVRATSRAAVIFDAGS